MKTLFLPQPYISSFFKKTTDHTVVTKPPVSSSATHSSNKHSFTAGEYIITALGEGFKQNFLGADINMEYLTLTVRSYATSTVKALRKLAAKPAAKQSNNNQTSI